MLIDMLRDVEKRAGPASAEKNPFSPTDTIRKPTGIQILDHDGPSRAQIVTTDESKETGWTNSYRPSTPPLPVAKGSGAGK